MKIKNEYVQIKQSNKTYTKRNMILNRYLNGMLNNQIDPEINNYTSIEQCYIKLDTPIPNVDYDSNLTASDFDITLYANYNGNLLLLNKIFKSNTILLKDKIVLNYKFTKNGYFMYNNQFGILDEFSQFNNRKITAIGFGGYNRCYAFVDVSNMNIILNTNEEFIISRTDTIQSDAICNGFEFPLHLVNFNAFYDVNSSNEFKVGQLYSIGLGNKIGLMETEHIITNKDIQDNKVTINFSDLIKVGHYPSEDLHLGFLPTMDNSRYLILKYQLYKMNVAMQEKYPLNEYYTMNYKYDLSQYEGQTKNISFNLEIERM